MNYLSIFGFIIYGINRLNKSNENIRNGKSLLVSEDLLDLGLFFSSIGLLKSINHNKMVDKINDSVGIRNGIINMF